MKKIKALTVIYEDGTDQSWLGRGQISIDRTPVAATGTPTLKDSDISFVQATLRFTRTQ